MDCQEVQGFVHAYLDGEFGEEERVANLVRQQQAGVQPRVYTPRRKNQNLTEQARREAVQAQQQVRQQRDPVDGTQSVPPPGYQPGPVRGSMKKRHPGKGPY